MIVINTHHNMKSSFMAFMERWQPLVTPLSHRSHQCSLPAGKLGSDRSSGPCPGCLMLRHVVASFTFQLAGMAPSWAGLVLRTGPVPCSSASWAAGPAAAWTSLKAQQGLCERQPS